RAWRRHVGIDMDRDGVSLHRIDRKIYSKRPQDARGRAAKRNDIGVGVEYALIGDDAGDAAAFEPQLLHARVELEHDAASRQNIGERDRELVTVAGLVIG